MVWLELLVSCLVTIHVCQCAKICKTDTVDSWVFNWDFWLMKFVDKDLFYIALNTKNSKIERIMLKFMIFLYWFWVLKTHCLIWLLCWFIDGLRHAALQLFLLRIRIQDIIWKHDTMLCLKTLLWLFTPAWDTVNSPWKLASSVLFQDLLCSWSLTLLIRRLYRSNNRVVVPGPSSIYPKHRTPAFLSMVIKLASLLQC